MKPPQLGFGFEVEAAVRSPSANQKAYKKAWKAENRDKINKERRAKRAVWSLHGLCPGCGKEREDRRFTKCIKCRKQVRDAILKKHEAHKAKKRETYWKDPDKHRAQSKLWCDANREYKRMADREYGRLNPQKRREYLLRHEYGMTVAEWETLFESQGRCCVLCGTKAPGRRGWMTDHCHSTGTVRGILCHHCNLGLGCFKDDPDLLAKASMFLRKHKLTLVV